MSNEFENMTLGNVEKIGKNESNISAKNKSVLIGTIKSIDFSKCANEEWTESVFDDFRSELNDKISNWNSFVSNGVSEIENHINSIAKMLYDENEKGYTDICVRCIRALFEIVNVRDEASKCDEEMLIKYKKWSQQYTDYLKTMIRIRELDEEVSTLQLRYNENANDYEKEHEEYLSFLQTPNGQRAKELIDIKKADETLTDKDAIRLMEISSRLSEKRDTFNDVEYVISTKKQEINALSQNIEIYKLAITHIPVDEDKKLIDKVEQVRSDMIDELKRSIGEN